MTTQEVLRSLRAAWLIVVVGLLLTVLGSYHLTRESGIYWSRVSVFFLAPADVERDNENTIAFTSDSVIATAGLVAHLVGPSRSDASTSSDTSMVAEGLGAGHRVRLPNTGGQWAANFNQPMLDVEVVGSDPDDVGRETTKMADEIAATLRALQADDRVPRNRRITTTRAPAAVQVHYASGDPKRALAGSLLLGVALTLLTAVGWDRRRRLG